jgi:hypothetical protein
MRINRRLSLTGEATEIDTFDFCTEPEVRRRGRTSERPERGRQQKGRFEQQQQGHDHHYWSESRTPEQIRSNGSKINRKIVQQSEHIPRCSKVGRIVRIRTVCLFSVTAKLAECHVLR